MAATRAGIPFFSRRKSIERYCFLCPPPRCQMVISPWALRPPVRFFGSTSDFSGVCLVISLLSSMVTKRRDAVYGLKLFSAITFSFPQARPGLKIVRVLDHLFASRQLYVSLLPVAPMAFRAAAAAKLPVKNSRAHSGNLYLENLLDRFLDLRLRRGHGHFKHDRMLRLLHPETFLGDDGPANHVIGVDIHRSSSAYFLGLLLAFVLFRRGLFLRGLFHGRSFFLGRGLGHLRSLHWLCRLNIDHFGRWRCGSGSQRRSQTHSRLFRQHQMIVPQ